MRNIFLTISFLLITIFSVAQVPKLAWVNGSNGTLFQHQVVVDQNQNVYTAGCFQGTKDFDPGPATYNLTSVGGWDIVIQKLDSFGNFLWAVSMGGEAGNEQAPYMTIDNAGNLILSGWFGDSLDIDPGPGINRIYSVDIADGYIVKLDSSGNFIWGHSFGSPGLDYPRKSVVDDNDNIYLSGSFQDTIDFDFGPSQFLLNTIEQASFMLKIDANSNFIWANKFEPLNSNSFCRSFDVTLSQDGYLYSTGDFVDSVDFNQGVGVDIHVANPSFLTGVYTHKMDTMGNFIWCKTNSNPDQATTRGIITDEAENVYVVGRFTGPSFDFDPNAGVYLLNSYGLRDGFIQKLDSSGNFVWAKQVGGPGNDEMTGVFIDSGEVFIHGTYSNTADFSLDNTGWNLTSNGNADMFVISIDTIGIKKWVRGLGSFTNDYGLDITGDQNGNLYFSGTLQGPGDMDPGPIKDTVFNGLGNNGFVTKWGSCIESYSTIYDTVCNVYNSPNGQQLTTSGVYTQYLLSATGCDSIITINLVVNYSSNYFWYVTACDTFTSPSGLGFNADSTFNDTIPNHLGCDSVLYIYLTVNQSASSTSFSNDTITCCGPYTSPSGNYTWTTSGNYNDTIGNYLSCDSIMTINLTVNPPPVANYSWINNGLGNYSFNNLSTGTYNQSHWAYGDGNTSLTTSPNHSFLANGAFTVVLTVNDSAYQNCYDYKVDTLNVSTVGSPLTCLSGFVIYPDTATGNVTVINTSVGSNLSYFWEFGDGDTSSLAFPSHTYATAGPFYICLTVDDGAGCIDMYCDSIGTSGVVFKQTGFTINVIDGPIITDVNSIENNTELSVYPIPTLEYLFVKASYEVKRVEIFDVMGKSILSERLKANRINVSSLTKGIYFLRAESKEGFLIRKFIVQ